LEQVAMVQQQVQIRALVVLLLLEPTLVLLVVLRVQAEVLRVA
jgi:hypothetical protein